MEGGGDGDDSNEEFVMWKSWMLHKMELIRHQVKYMMNVLGKKSSKFSKFLLMVRFLWNSKGR
jgi:hypothetical protein